MVTPDLLEVAAPPSAVANAPLLAEVESVKRPPAVIRRGPRSVASELVLARLIPTAAATLIPPAEVLAAGVGSAPAVPLPLLSVEVFAAKLRCAATWRST